MALPLPPRLLATQLQQAFLCDGCSCLSSTRCSVLIATRRLAAVFRLPYIPAMAKTHIMRIELTQSAKTKLNKLSDQQGMTQVAMMSRLFEFFYAQDNAMKHVMVGRFPSEIEAEAAALILKRLKPEPR